ncbi:hypothetical protein V8C40DRAFT_24101 [Trichoderma camerunense]
MPSFVRWVQPGERRFIVAVCLLVVLAFATPSAAGLKGPTASQISQNRRRVARHPAAAMTADALLTLGQGRCQIYEYTVPRIGPPRAAAQQQCSSLAYNFSVLRQSSFIPTAWQFVIGLYQISLGTKTRWSRKDFSRTMRRWTVRSVLGALSVILF